MTGVDGRKRDAGRARERSVLRAAMVDCVYGCEYVEEE